MKLTYRVVREHGRFIAECIESEVAGEGATVQDAVASLRSALEERMFRPDAVAPPPEPAESVIELVEVSAGARSSGAPEAHPRSPDARGGCAR